VDILPRALRDASHGLASLHGCYVIGIELKWLDMRETFAWSKYGWKKYAYFIKEGLGGDEAFMKDYQNIKVSLPRESDPQSCDPRSSRRR